MKATLKKFLSLGLLFGVLSGCSENKITITNESEYFVTFSFRGDLYSVSPNKSSTIEGVPNGTYAYGTKVEVPEVAWIKSVNLEGLNGDLHFLRDETEHMLLYGSHLMDSVLTISLLKSSSDPVSNSLPTAP